MNGEQQAQEDARSEIDLQNNYRIEYIKHLLAISTGVFVFSVTFIKDLIPQNHWAHMKDALILGWGALVASTILGVFHLRLWSIYYTPWGLQFDKKRVDSRRRWIGWVLFMADGIQIVSFCIGIAALFAFGVANTYDL